MIYVNISNTINTRGKTGIQRVVNELCSEFIKIGNYTLLAYQEDGFYVVNDHFVRSVDGDKKRKFDFSTIQKGDILFDPDASWGDFYDVEGLLREFKSRGSIIVKLHHDAVPILYPNFSHMNTMLRYKENFSQAAIYADYWICVSEKVEKDLKSLFSKLSLPAPQTYVLALGANINLDQSDETEIGDTCRKILKKKYIISVGTVEPRKNHEAVIDVFDTYRKLKKDKNLNLVLVGKSGWNNEEIVTRIETHPLYNKNIFWLKSANDSELDALYKNAVACLCLSHYEGFGLPVVESLARGSQVICTADSSMEEVSRGFAFPVNLNTREIVTVLHGILTGATLKDLSKFSLPKWSDAAKFLDQTFREITADPVVNPKPKQAVYISVRPIAVRRSIQSVVDKMPFIKSIVVLTSDSHYQDLVNAIKDIEVDILVIKESEIGITSLPDDHLERNTLLRSALYSQPVIEENFIAFDDDYTVVRSVGVENFYSDGKHISYFYFERNDEWRGALPEPTSFDNGVWRTRKYLSEGGYDTRLYGSHQPQIINKTLARLTLSVAKNYNLDEWSSYFNIAKHLKPSMFVDRIYQAGGWPAEFGGWLPSSAPNEILFFNDLEDDGKISAADQVSNWRETLYKHMKLNDKLHPKSIKLFIQSENAYFSDAIISCPLNSTIFIPINRSVEVDFFAFTFNDWLTSQHYTNIPNYIHLDLPAHNITSSFKVAIQVKVCGIDHILTSEIKVVLCD